MTGPWAWFAKFLLRSVLPIGGLALLAGFSHGPAWGWAIAALGWLLLVFMHRRQWAALAAWLDSVESTERCQFPQAGGVWGEVLGKLAQRQNDQARRLEEVETRLGSFTGAMDAVPDGLVILDAGHRIQWSNRAAGAHLGIRLPRDDGVIIEHLVRTPGFAEYLANADSSSPFVLQVPAARTRVYTIRVVPLGDANKLVVSLDVTDARRVESMRSTFVANVSHELRTPLTVVSGFLEYFNDEGAVDAEQRKQFARLMSDQTARMLTLVDDLLTLSRLEAEDAPASEEDVDMADLLAQLRAEGQSLSDGRHRLEVICQGPALHGNRKELHSAFGNLVSNAIRYTPAGGEIRIEWAASDGCGVFSVCDSGVGVAAEHLPRLTERFYRVDRGRSRGTGGTGLGLAIVKHILLRHQANLSIESEVGAGSTFRAAFPDWRLSPGK
ncbi:MAG: Phosphate regulon sensor protein PhoR [Candidatus Accumulibacter appositus]|uniref:histidine kinase n=1 Tax=Candidatus Accumulibacter appositus TaxID=1454003 RepID=A0A011NZX1_9PROT|nr:phosphate regulon sensor histidine kinase PhoR [Accumulibacter sp.]EXI80901.1 MAG: Phosphate regulon sensor protein PhoR [Candidatus Accumulibacter appositus]HRF03843.1 phosphate regulon sensor histidine kinase PhoR [Accumulibacter sp.]